MTAQFSERLIYQGTRHPLYTEPLSQYFQFAGIDPAFDITSTALWRGYIGTWKIIDERLYLIQLSDGLEYRDRRYIEDQDAHKSKYRLETWFPGFPRRVFAHWFSGTLDIPQGKLLKYVHMGYLSQFEKNLLIDVEFGVITNTRARTNTTQDHDRDASKERRIRDLIKVGYPDGSQS